MIRKLGTLVIVFVLATGCLATLGCHEETVADLSAQLQQLDDDLDRLVDRILEGRDDLGV